MIGNKKPLVQKTPARKNHTKPNRGKYVMKFMERKLI